MGDAPSLHAFVFCWPRWEAAAHGIAGALAGALDGPGDRLTVLYKNDTGVEESGAGEWRRIPSDRYYGWQFRESLGLNGGDVMMHVQADASYGDWPRLVARCREAFGAVPSLGVWAPDVYHTPWTPRLTGVRPLRGDDLLAVTLTDGILWALSRPLVERLLLLDYGGNNLGWGIGQTAAAVAVTNGMAVAMDLSLPVKHPQGSGYDRGRAQEELTAFLAQLTPAQRAYIDMAVTLARLRERQHLHKYLQPGFWRGKLGLRGSA